MLQILSLLIKIVHLQDDAFDDGLRYSQINTQTFIDAEREQNETDYPNISLSGISTQAFIEADALNKSNSNQKKVSFYMYK